MQWWLLSEEKLIFDKAVAQALAMETAEWNVHDLQQPPIVDVHSLADLHPSSPCPHYWGKHCSTECHSKNAECDAHGKKGHISRVCHSNQCPQLSHCRSKPLPKKTYRVTVHTCSRMFKNQVENRPEHPLFQFTCRVLYWATVSDCPDRPQGSHYGDGHRYSSIGH